MPASTTGPGGHGRLLESAGYNVAYTAGSHDGGIDLIASRPDLHGAIQLRLYVQCKSQTHPVGVDVVRALIGALPSGQGSGVVVSPGGFSAEARQVARDRGVTLWGPEDIARLGSESAGSPGHQDH